jgi:hypothetical protein
VAESASGNGGGNGGPDASGPGRAPGPGAPPGRAPGTAAALRRLRRPLYGLALALTAPTCAAVAAVTALGFALAWGPFAHLRVLVAGNRKREEPPFSNTGDAEVALFGAGALAVLLLLLLATVLLGLYLAASAAAVRHLRDGGGPLGAAALWRRTRPHALRAVAAQAPTVAGVAVTALLGVALFDDLADGGLIPGIDRPQSPFTGYRAVDWVVGLGLPLAAACVGPYLYARFSLAASVVVAEGAPAGRALRRSWRLTRSGQGRLLGAWAAAAAAAVAAAALLRLAAAPLARPAGEAMSLLSGGNVYTSGAFAAAVPVAVALALLPATVLPPVGVALALRHAAARDAAGPPGRVD